MMMMRPLPPSLLALILLLASSLASPIPDVLTSVDHRQDFDPDPPPLPPQSQVEPGTVVCRPFGLCEPCPEDALDQPYCQPYGNRRLIHCVPYSSLPHMEGIHDYHGRPPSSPPSSLNRTSILGELLDTPGETPAWEACGKVVAKELADFWEFVMCNLVFLAISLFIYLARSRKLAAVQYRQLAARIGLTRGSGWTAGG